MARAKFPLPKRLEIGRRIYTGEMKRNEAAVFYGIDPTTARDYMRLYRDTEHLPPSNTPAAKSLIADRHDLVGVMMDTYRHMTKRQLLQEVFRLRLMLDTVQQS